MPTLLLYGNSDPEFAPLPYLMAKASVWASAEFSKRALPVAQSQDIVDTLNSGHR